MKIKTYDTPLFPGDIIQCARAPANKWHASLLFVIGVVDNGSISDSLRGKKYKYWSFKFNDVWVFDMSEVIGCEIILRAF